MCNIEHYFLDIRKGIRRLKRVVNVLEETVNVLEEALEESSRLGEIIAEPDQWLQLWADHIDSFRKSIREYYGIFKQSSQTSQQLSLIRNSIYSYSIQVTQYVHLVQAYCLGLLSEGGENCFSQIEERINHLSESLNNLPELTDVSLVRNRLLKFRNLVLAIETLLSEQALSISDYSISLSEEELENYRQLVALLHNAIATWESKISLHESELSDVASGADYLLEAREEIRQFLADLSDYTRLAQKIYRNLLEL